MILRAFPDIGWLQQQAKNDFADVWRTEGGQHARRGWPTVILHTVATKAVRPDIKGPLSLFTNIGGRSTVAVGKQRAVVGEQVYFISNQGQHYTLTIEHSQPVETLNIHFAPYFADRVLQSIVQPAASLLEREFEVPELSTGFFNQLYWRDSKINRCLAAIQAKSYEGLTGTLWYEEQLAVLLEQILACHSDIMHTVSLLPPAKASTKLEIYKRLSKATDYIYTRYNHEISLDELSGIACISKFHFLRLFRQVFHTTPYRFIAKLRIETACMLLHSSTLPIYDIATHVGFSSQPAFSRAFYRAMGVYPDVYRQQVRGR